jgi:hypothetical protein
VGCLRKLFLLLLLFGRGVHNAAKAKPGLHHGKQSYRRVNSPSTAPSTTLIYLVEDGASWSTRPPYRGIIG